MFVVSRKIGESVVVGGDSVFGRVVRVTVTDVANGHVKLSFDVNSDVSIEATEPLTRRDIITSYVGGLPRGMPQNGQRRLLRKLADARQSGVQPNIHDLTDPAVQNTYPAAFDALESPDAATPTSDVHSAAETTHATQDEPANDSSGVLTTDETGDCPSKSPDRRRTMAS